MKTDHLCRWPNCTERVPVDKWGCERHWLQLPADIRSAISRAYRPGQEDRRLAGRAYLRAASDAQRWISGQGPKQGVLLERRYG